MMGKQGEAKMGRMGDSYLGHLSKGEMVVPPASVSPATMSMVQRDMMSSGLDPQRYTVGSNQMSINPMTGKPEFGFNPVSSISKAIKSVGKGVGNVFGKGVDLIKDYGVDFGKNYVMSGGNPYLAAAQTAGGAFGGDFGRALATYGYGGFNPTTGGINPLEDNPFIISEQPQDFGISNLGNLIGVGSDFLSALGNEQYNPYKNFQADISRSEFQPVSVRTGLTYTDFLPATGRSPAKLTGTLDPSLQRIQAASLLGAEQLLPEALTQLVTDQPARINFLDDIQSRQADIFKETSALLEPEFQQRTSDLAQQVLGTGRGGLRTVEGGQFVQPDLFGEQLARERALGELAASARTQAGQELTSQLDRILAQAEFNEEQRRERLRNLLAGGQEFLKTGIGIDELASRNQQLAAQIYLERLGMDKGIQQQLARQPQQPSLLSELGGQFIATAGEGLIDKIFN